MGEWRDQVVRDLTELGNERLAKVVTWALENLDREIVDILNRQKPQ